MNCTNQNDRKTETEWPDRVKQAHTPTARRSHRSRSNSANVSALTASVADMDAATVDPKTGELKPEFVPDSSIGSPGDKLHPDRAGYQAMANTVDIKVLAPRTTKGLAGGNL